MRAESNQNGSEKTIIAPCVADPQDVSSECALVRPDDPCSIVILGATGDLTARKLMPSLFNLYRNQGLPEPFTIVGCGRTPLDHQGFRKKIENAVMSALDADHKTWQAFAKLLYYQTITYDDVSSFDHLKNFVKDLDKKNGTGGNRMFYLALPPSLYQPVTQMLGQAAHA